jgi:signal transduction histidine kinase
MRKLIQAMVLCIGGLAFSVSAADVERANSEEAVRFVKNAVAYLKKNGETKAFADFADIKNAQFHDRDLYLFVYDFKGINVAHGNNPKMVGKNLLEMKDADGTPIIRSFIEVAGTKGSGWVDYMWPNPVTKAIENKSSYIERVGDLIIGAGIYRPVKK